MYRQGLTHTQHDAGQQGINEVWWEVVYSICLAQVKYRQEAFCEHGGSTLAKREWLCLVIMNFEICNKVNL